MSKRKTNERKKAFTLIELLVVIAIIGLLSTLSIIAFNQARARARDARRLADVKQIQTALEMYYNDMGCYPPALSVSGGSLATGSTVYMDIIPKPPTPADNQACAGTTFYTYVANNYGGTNNGTYSLRYCLGNNTGGIFATLNTATPAGISSAQPAACAPSCAGKVCGDNGCGGSCGTCQSGNCVNGTCQAIICTPDCREKTCGDDGCGGSCGRCYNGATCVHGVCEGGFGGGCTPDCRDKVCGDDGCEGSCGECREEGTVCDRGVCVRDEGGEIRFP